MWRLLCSFISMSHTTNGLLRIDESVRRAETIGAPGPRHEPELARFEKNLHRPGATIIDMTQPQTSFGLATIGQIAVTVTDLDRAILFYRHALGMPLLCKVPNMAFFDCAGIQLMLGLAEK